MPRNSILALLAVPLVMIHGGCAERALKEATGAALGAEGKVVALPAQPGAASLTNYKAFQIDSVAVSPDLVAPADLAEVVKTKWAAALTDGQVAATESPNAIVKAEIVHYEGASLVDAAAGPFTQIIVHATLIDAATQQPLRSANLVGRSTSVMAGTPDALAGGSSKALLQWLGECGVPVKTTTGSITNLAANPTGALATGAGSIAGVLPGAAALTGTTAGTGTGAVTGALAGGSIATAFSGATAVPGMAAMPNTSAIPGMTAMPGAAAVPAGAMSDYAATPGGMSAANMPTAGMPNTGIPGQPSTNFPQGVGYPNQQAPMGAFSANGTPNPAGIVATNPGAMQQNPAAFSGKLPVGSMNPAMQSMPSLLAGYMPNQAAMPSNFTGAAIPAPQPGMQLPQGMAIPDQQSAMGALPANAMPNAALMTGATPQNPAAVAGNFANPTMNPAMQAMSSLPAGYAPNQMVQPNNFNPAAYSQPGMSLPQGTSYPTAIPNTGAMTGALPQNPAEIGGSLPVGSLNPAMPNSAAIPTASVPGAPGIPANLTNAAIPGQAAYTAALQNRMIPNAAASAGTMQGMIPQYAADFTSNIPTVAIDQDPVPAAAASAIPDLPTRATIPSSPALGGAVNQLAPTSTVPGSIEQILPESVSTYAPAVSSAIKNAPTHARLQDTAKSAVDQTIRVESLPAIAKPNAISAVPQPPAPPPIQEVPINN